MRESKYVWENLSASEYAEHLNNVALKFGRSQISEDSDFWSERGVNTGYDLEKYLTAGEVSLLYRNLQRDFPGVRPRNFDFENMSLDELREVHHDLDREYEKYYEESLATHDWEREEYWDQGPEDYLDKVLNSEQDPEDPYEMGYERSPREVALENRPRGKEVTRVEKGRIKGTGPREREKRNWKGKRRTQYAMSKKMLNGLNKIADELDKKGFLKEADKIDVVIKKVAEMSTEDAWNNTDWPKKLKRLRLAELGLVQYANTVGADSEEEVPVFKSVLNCLEELRKAEEWYVNKLGGRDQTKDVGTAKPSGS